VMLVCCGVTVRAVLRVCTLGLIGLCVQVSSAVSEALRCSYLIYHIEVSCSSPSNSLQHCMQASELCHLEATRRSAFVLIIALMSARHLG